MKIKNIKETSDRMIALFLERFRLSRQYLISILDPKSLLCATLLTIIFFQYYYMTLMSQEILELKQNNTLLNNEAVVLRDQLNLLTKKGLETALDPVEVLINNGTTPYLKILGGCIVVIAACYLVSSIFPGFFTLKNLVPVKFYTIVQSYTSFFQTKDTYVFRDEDIQVDWLVNVLQGNKLDIFLKSYSSADYIKAAEYIATLQAEVYILTRKHAVYFPEYTLEQTTAAVAYITGGLG